MLLLQGTTKRSIRCLVNFSDYTLDIEGKLLESGRITPIAHLIKIPEDTDVAWHTKFRNKSYSFKDLKKKKN
jgi:hypothetical protein